MIVGISGVVVFSYKIFHSRVYPVGMVRKMPVPQENIEEASTGLSASQSGLQAELMSLLEKGWSIKETARDLHHSEQDILKHYLLRMKWKEVYAKRRQSGGSQFKFALHNLHLGETAILEWEDSALEDEIVEHGEALKSHSKQFEDLEKRIRRLESESVQKLQEAAEEKPQPPQTVH
jgi:hypothetical protein